MYTIQVMYLDPERRFQWLDGQAAFAFGKHKGFALAQAAAVDARYMVRSRQSETRFRQREPHPVSWRACASNCCVTMVDRQDASKE